MPKSSWAFGLQSYSPLGLEGSNESLCLQEIQLVEVRPNNMWWQVYHMAHVCFLKTKLHSSGFMRIPTWTMTLPNALSQEKSFNWLSAKQGRMGQKGKMKGSTQRTRPYSQVNFYIEFCRYSSCICRIGNHAKLTTVNIFKHLFAMFSTTLTKLKSDASQKEMLKFICSRNPTLWLISICGLVSYGLHALIPAIIICTSDPTFWKNDEIVISTTSCGLKMH